MGIKSVPINKFRKYLKSLGLELIRTKDSHEIYDYPDKHLLRPVTIDVNYPDVPQLHIHTNLKTLGINKKDFEEAIENF